MSVADQTHFADGKAAFERAFTPAMGLGPVFNEVSCVACHSPPVAGGGSTKAVTHFGRSAEGRSDPLLRLGGPVLQEKAVDPSCTETVPPEADVRARRITPPTDAGRPRGRGWTLFRRTGCAACHRSTLVTGPTTITVLEGKRFYPYSDFLLHDMGSLGDGIAELRAAEPAPAHRCPRPLRRGVGGFDYQPIPRICSAAWRRPAVRVR